MFYAIIFIIVLSMQSLLAEKPAKGGGQERFLEWEWDASWVPPEEEDDYREEELGADWPGKRQDPFFDTLTR